MSETIEHYASEPSRMRSRLIFLGILAVFFGPMFLAYVLFADSGWKPAGFTNHGELISPVRPLGETPLLAADGRTLDAGFWRGRWTLVYIGTGTCDIFCETSLFKMRQARLTLGRDIDRVQRLYLLTDTALDANAKQLLAEHQGMVLATQRGAILRRLSTVFGEDAQGKLFVIDPAGNLMMRYDDDSTTRGIHKDLKRLLKVSAIG